MIDYVKKEIHLIWNIEDIKEYAMQDFEIFLTDAEAMRILMEVYEKHDCTLGVSWSTFDYYIGQHKNKGQ